MYIDGLGLVTSGLWGGFVTGNSGGETLGGSCGEDVVGEGSPSAGGGRVEGVLPPAGTGYTEEGGGSMVEGGFSQNGGVFSGNGIGERDSKGGREKGEFTP